MEDPTPPLETLEMVGGLKTKLFEGPKSIGSLWVRGNSLPHLQRNLGFKSKPPVAGT